MRAAIFMAVCFMCLFALHPMNSAAEVHISNDFSYTFNDVAGKGNEQSSLTEGFRYLNILGINGNGTVSRFDYHFNIGSRLTDDRRTDIQTFVLTNLQAGLTNKTHSFNFGDTFQSFSQYSLSTSVKGDLIDFPRTIPVFPRLC